MISPLHCLTAGQQTVSSVELSKKVRTLWNVPALTCPSTQPTQTLPHLRPTMRPSMPQDSSASQVQHLKKNFFHQRAVNSVKRDE